MDFPCIFTAGLPENRQQQLKQQLAQSGIQRIPSRPASGLYLEADESGLGLALAGQKGRVYVDFVYGTARHRRLHGGGELLTRAVQASEQPSVWDATGGLGRDALVLATSGLNVQVFERHPVVYALLLDGWTRAMEDRTLSAIVQRIHLHQGCISDTPPAAQRPEVVYLDPMYPQRQKTAAVKKEMAYFHQLVGEHPIAEEQALLAAAQHLARKRIVVKRPHHGHFLAGQEPAFQYLGKTTRFDVYLPLA